MKAWWLQSWDPYEGRPPPRRASSVRRPEVHHNQHWPVHDEVTEQFGPTVEVTPDSIHTNAESNTTAITTYENDVLNHTQTGGFRVLEELGKGGFGVVSLCERTGPNVRCPLLPPLRIDSRRRSLRR